MSKPEVITYLVGLAQASGLAAPKVFRDNPPGVCFCAEVTLHHDGRFSHIDNIRSTREDIELEVGEALMEIEFGAVPKEASCLLHPPVNPMFFSLDSYDE